MRRLSFFELLCALWPLAIALVLSSPFFHLSRVEHSTTLAVIDGLIVLAGASIGMMTLRGSSYALDLHFCTCPTRPGWTRELTHRDKARVRRGEACR